MTDMSDESAAQGPGPDARFRHQLANGKFMIQRCRQCGKHVFYPRLLCPSCGLNDLHELQATGRGTVYSTSIVRQKAEHGGDYNVALIELEEGPRMMSKVIDIAPSDVRIGMPVMAALVDIEGKPAVVFRPAEEVRI